MPMSYNKALDQAEMALTYGRRAMTASAAGNTEAAAKFMMKAGAYFAAALKEPDLLKAIGILESSNKAAHAQMTASAKKVKAAEEDEFEIEGEEGDEHMEPEETEEEAVEASSEEGDEEDEEEGEGKGFGPAFAKLLASMMREPAAKTAKKK